MLPAGPRMNWINMVEITELKHHLHVGTAVCEGQDCQIGGWTFYFPVDFWCLQHHRIKIIPDQWVIRTIQWWPGQLSTAVIKRNLT